MAATDWEFPFVLECPVPKGRKPTSIPDTTQFSRITECLFGVTCATPEEPYRWGFYNELYLLDLNVPLDRQGQVPDKVLARVARDVKSRSDISMESEIATMVFVRLKTTIPVPVVYGYCPTRHNAIGQAFSIISFTEGSDMNGSPWEDLAFELKLNAIRDYARIVLQLSQLKFDRIGSIYFKHDVAPPNCFRLGPVAWCKHESAARKRNCSYDRGPWKVSGPWLRAGLTEEIEFMERLPELAKTSYGYRNDINMKWRLAQDVLPRFRDRIRDVIEDELDGCAAGPFVLAHMDFNPWNIIIAPDGPNAGHILAIIDWEMAMTVPLWTLVCHPLWFESRGCQQNRDPLETRLFKDTYVRELQRYTTEPLVLRVVQNSRLELKKRFAEIAVASWDKAECMKAWMDKHPKQER
ncbi:phosphotransferase enzyme family-domain-containing protein [Desarmillaria ectypa]|nr:phosphotransferase enzyme family-domain-containing protein [Desarmillaria ectypa]